MRTLSEALDRFAYHPAGPDTVARHAALRTAYLEFVPRVWELIPDGPEKTLALRKLSESLMAGSQAIALTGPAAAPDAPLLVRELADPEATALLAKVTGAEVTPSTPSGGHGRPTCTPDEPDPSGILGPAGLR